MNPRTMGMNRRRQLPAHPRHQGFTLIEVLVAIVVFSFGLLGMVGLQAAAMQANRESRMQNQATALARELAEMMRGNKNVAILSTNNPYLGEFAVGSLALASPSYCLNASNASTGCSTTAAVASAQMTDWLARVDAALPGARVSVCLDSAPYDSSGMPQWACNATGANEIAFIKIGWTQGSTDRTLTGANAFVLASGNSARPNLVFPITSGNSL